MKVKLFSVLTILLFSANAYSQMFYFNVYNQGASTNYLVASFKNQNLTFCSVDDLTKALQLSSATDRSTLRQEIFLGGGRIFLSAYNPFIIYKGISGQEVIHQMSTESDYRYGTIYIPINDFIDLVNKINEQKLFIDYRSNIIRIERGQVASSITRPHPQQQAQSDIKTSSEPQYPPTVIKSGTAGVQKSSSAFDIYDFDITEKSNGYIFRLKSKKPIKNVSKNYTAKTFYLRLNNVTIDSERFNTKINNGLISEIATLQQQNKTDVKLILNYELQSNEVVSEKGSNDILILLHVKPDIVEKIRETRIASQASKNNVSFDVVVIDAGHGGKDGGAVGYNGTKEKDINLAITLKLGAILKSKNPNLKVVYTRDDDRFIELYRRGQIANENNGKLFISIHCNSTPARPGTSQGYEIYLLRPGRTEDAIKIAERENSVIKLEEGYEERYKHLSDENFILTAMSQTANVKHSEKFAEILDEKFRKTLPIKRNGVKQAGFYVLVGASMPSVLIETAFLNNPTDERFLNTSSGQQQFADAIYRAIIDYKNYYEEVASK
ncbi:MAG: N-acetylmuramoyl-L-alanine amidase [Bacteroidetes bacterium]|nr:N-acetylmuramoyl-L-alanine amidase [Bacteroidota bacterium]MBU2585453.1 N-acetylmuramoyl-L-alanine amidase [Bacteroidota bacterium]